MYHFPACCTLTLLPAVVRLPAFLLRPHPHISSGRKDSPLKQLQIFSQPPPDFLCRHGRSQKNRALFPQGKQLTAHAVRQPSPVFLRHQRTVQIQKDRLIRFRNPKDRISPEKLPPLEIGPPAIGQITGAPFFAAQRPENFLLFTLIPVPLFDPADIAGTDPAVGLHEASVAAHGNVRSRTTAFQSEKRIQLQKGPLLLLRIGASQPVHLIDPQVEIRRQPLPQPAKQRDILRRSHCSHAQINAAVGQPVTLVRKLLYICHLRVKSRPDTELSPGCAGNSPHDFLRGFLVAFPVAFPAIFPVGIPAVQIKNCQTFLHRKAQIRLQPHPFQTIKPRKAPQSFPIPPVDRRLPVRHHKDCADIEFRRPVRDTFTKSPEILPVLFQFLHRRPVFGKRTVGTAVITTFQAPPVTDCFPAHSSSPTPAFSS